MTLDHSRMGTFVVTFDFLRCAAKDRWSALMGDIVIVDVEVDLDLEQFVYTATSDKFSELTETAMVPRYIPTWNYEEGHYTWRAL